ncbi:hypothetical protein BJY04DRAFT_32673 [Aspergillus karnatakaensis]|uniref:putative AT DNA binding protein n=1 Tax=Aspergillus karnatakaensis TaxID=1810916 RepID=UPI003CCCD559
MSNPRERPWTEDEKYALLTEILKKAGVHSRMLVKMIKDMNIAPSWADIPLPSGRSLNSCQSAFQDMCHELPPPPVNHAVGPPPPRHHVPVQQMPHPDQGGGRKRPFYSSDKPYLAPRPALIQPRPATSTAPYSNESGAPAILSPGTGAVTARGEPARKRGRPSKAEAERRKAEAEARGETYPPLRRTGKVKVSSTPTSPSGIEAGGPPMFASQMNARPPTVPQPGMGYVPQPPLRTMSMSGPSGEDRMRSMQNRDIPAPLRELPRPTDIRQTLPSPHAMQLGPRETIPRIEPGDRPYEPLPSDRLPFTDSSRRSLVHPPLRHTDAGPAPDIAVPLTTTAEKRTE